MWALIVSVPDHCLSFYLETFGVIDTGSEISTVSEQSWES